MTHEEKKKIAEDVVCAGMTIESCETIQKYGSATKEHYVAYSGVDNEIIDPTTGQAFRLQKSLRSIKNQKNNAEYAFSIEQQKAGWGAEVKDAANVNAERIIVGDDVKKVRHDDLPNMPANHQLYDHVEIDKQGNIISGSETQMKFIGASAKNSSSAGNAKRAMQKLQSKEFQKYIDNDVKIEVPKDEYKQMLDVASDEIISLQKQLNKAVEAKDAEAVTRIQKKIDNIDVLKKNLRSSTLTREQAIESIKHPVISTAKSVADISHRAGVQAAESAAVIAGGISIAKNIKDVCKGEIDTEDAIENIAIDTVQSAAIGYGTSFAGSAINGVMKNSASEFVRSIAEGNTVIQVAGIVNSLKGCTERYVNGEIDGGEYLHEVLEDGMGYVVSYVGYIVGDIFGGPIGGASCSYVLSTTYNELVFSIRNVRTSKRRLKEMQEVAARIKSAQEQYKQEFNEAFRKYYENKEEKLNQAYDTLCEGFKNNNIDQFLSAINDMSKAFGAESSFGTYKEVDKRMSDPTMVWQF